jgi:hypothetical protein
MANRIVKIMILSAAIYHLAGCSLVQWLPSSACDKVIYERVARNVTVYAECKV